jgi:hypothetical protein
MTVAGRMPNHVSLVGEPVARARKWVDDRG